MDNIRPRKSHVRSNTLTIIVPSVAVLSATVLPNVTCYPCCHVWSAAVTRQAASEQQQRCRVAKMLRSPHRVWRGGGLAYLHPWW